MSENKTGTYKYDPKLKKVVKVSAAIPSVSKSGSGHQCNGCCHHCSHDD